MSPVTPGSLAQTDSHSTVKEFGLDIDSLIQPVTRWHTRLAMAFLIRSSITVTL